MEAMEICRGPFIFSHSNAYAVVPHYRNIRDDQIRACARSGGLIGINGVNEFLGDPGASSEAMFRHLDHISSLVGPQHVGIGLDYVQNLEAVWAWVQNDRQLWPDNGDAPPEYPAHGQPEQIRELVALMLARGYAASDVADILGNNFLRVMRAARTVALERGGMRSGPRRADRSGPGAPGVRRGSMNRRAGPPGHRLAADRRRRRFLQ